MVNFGTQNIEVPKYLQKELNGTFGPIVEAYVDPAKNQLNEERKELLNRLAYVQYNITPIAGSLNESSTFAGGNYATPTNTLGMGNPSFGSTIGSQAAFNTGAVGSGDKWVSPFAIAMQIAAKTVGFDIVNTIPISAPTGMVTYVDWQYSDGKLNGTGNDNPAMIRVNIPNFTGVAGQTYIVTSAYSSPTASGNGVRLKYVAKTRIMGESIFQVLGSGTVSGNVVTETETIKVSDAFTGSANIFITTANVYTANTLATVTAANGTAQLVNALEDQITGFAGGPGGVESATFGGNYIDGSSYYEGMTRGESEESKFRTAGMKQYNKYIETKEFKVAFSATQQQIMDMKRVHGFDLIGKAETFLVNETSQNINKSILGTAYAMGWTNHYNIYNADGVTFNLNLKAGDTGAANITNIDNTNTSRAIPMPDFVNYSGATASFENQGTLHARIANRILYASNYILNRGRVGMANFVVTNITLGTALIASKDSSVVPYVNTLSGKDLYPAGTVYGMTLYIDPYLAPNKNLVLVGRKGADDEPGLKLLIYSLSESVSTIAEATLSSKIGVISRYAVVEYGQLPETQYITFECKLPSTTGGLV